MATKYPKTEQGIFDRVVKHFLLDKQPFGFDKTQEMCVYRGPNGEKCAVGLFMPDSEYKPTMEAGSVNDLVYRLDEKSAFFKWIVEHRYMLSALQNCHDEAAKLHTTDKRNKRRLMAKMLKLEFPELAKKSKYLKQYKGT